MAKLTITGVQHETGADGMSGQGYPAFSGATELAKGQIVAINGELASAVDKVKAAFGYVAWDTGRGVNGKVVANQSFRIVREAWVELDVAKVAGTKIYLSDVAGELSDVAGTEEIVVGVYIAEPENGNATDLSHQAVLDFKLY